VAVIPAGVLQSFQADPRQELEFVIFGTPTPSNCDGQVAPIHRTNTTAMARMIKLPVKTPICRD
jgi:hypothetical protein